MDYHLLCARVHCWAQKDGCCSTRGQFPSPCPPLLRLGSSRLPGLSDASRAPDFSSGWYFLQQKHWGFCFVLFASSYFVVTNGWISPALSCLFKLEILRYWARKSEWHLKSILSCMLAILGLINNLLSVNCCKTKLSGGLEGCNVSWLLWMYPEPR